MPENNKPPEKVKPGEKEPGIGEKEKEKGGDKISSNTGTNPAGGIINPDTENNGENGGRVIPIVIGGDDDKDDPITGGIQSKYCFPFGIKKLIAAFIYFTLDIAKNQKHNLPPKIFCTSA